MADFAAASVPVDSPTQDAGSPAAPVGNAQEVSAQLAAGQLSASEQDAAKAPKTESLLAKAAAELRRGMRGKKSVTSAAPEPKAEPEASEAPEAEDNTDGTQELAESKPEPKAKPERTDEDTRASLATKSHALRRQQARVERQQAELQQMMQQVRAEQEALAPWRQLAEGAAKDPGKTLGELAARAGISERAFLEQLTRKHLGKPADAASLATEVESLRSELQAIRSEQENRIKQAEQHSRFQADRQNDIRSIVEGLQDEQAAEDFPFASSLDADTLTEEVAKAVDACYQHLPNAGYEHVARMIDQHLQREAERFRKNEKLWARIATHTGTDPKNRDPSGTVPQNRGIPSNGGGVNRSTKARPSTVTNRDAAAASATGPITLEQRMALAANELRKGMR